EKCSLKIRNYPFKWDFSANGDAEWTYMLNRFSYLDLLTRVYKISKERKYLKKGLKLIEDWIEKVELVPNVMTRTLDTGMRIYYFINFDKNNDLNSKFSNKIKFSIYEQIKYLENNYIQKYNLSNWGLVQMISIAIAGIYYDDEELYLNAIEKLRAMIEMQYLDDGFIHWERSMGYHNFMLQWLLRLNSYQKEFNKDITFKKLIKNALTTTILASDLDGNQVNNGDSDKTSIDYLKKSYFEIYGHNIKKIDYKLFSEYGMYVEKREGSFLTTLNNNMSSNHTHADFTHFIYQNSNISILDGGRYTYTESKDRKIYKVFKHNNILIDSKSPFGYESSWETTNYPIVNPIFVKKKNGESFVEMSYFDENRRIFFKRKIFYTSEDDLIIFDCVFAKGNHIAKTNILGLNLDNSNIKSNRKYKFSKSHYSTEYNTKDSCDLFTTESSFRDKFTQIIIIGDTKNYRLIPIKQKGNVLDSNLAISVYNNRKYYIDISEEITKGNKILSVNNHEFYARNAVINEKGNIIIYR
ncbi:MAG: heparinase II/III family protein, partial [Tissierellia bacterium]|nr:heparinase II/III family protein [Tissierellia bacterium]